MTTPTRRWLLPVFLGTAAIAALAFTSGFFVGSAHPAGAPTATVGMPGATSTTERHALATADLLPFDSAPVPSIDNTSPHVGDVLTATAGDWEPTPDTLSYQWSSEGVAIDGAVSSQYLVQPADLDAQLSVTVTATADGYADTSVPSDDTDAVTAGTLAPGAVTLSGTATFGQTLSVDPGTWGPGDVILHYDWLRDGVTIGADDLDSYMLTSEDIHSVISVRVTGSEAGYASQDVLSNSTESVQALSFASTPVPVVSDARPYFDEDLTAQNTDDWDAGATLSYTWLRDGDPIDGAANLSTYTTTLADVGHTISVTVTGAEDGYTTVAETSDPTASVGTRSFDATPVPTISDVNPLINEGLAVDNTAGWDAGAALSYTWLRDGDPIDGAADLPSYSTTIADLGHTISVTVTATEDGYTTASETSDATTPVAALSFDSTPTPTLSDQNPVFNEQLTAGNTDGWDAGAELSYTWLRDGTPIDGAEDSPSYTTTVVDVGHAISVTVTGTEVGYTTVAKTSAATADVVERPFGGTPDVSLTGPSSGAHTYRVDVTGWTPDPGTEGSYLYQWDLNGVPIADATTATYLAKSGDVGGSLTVSVTPAVAGYTADPVVSNAITIAAAYFKTVQPTVSDTTPQVGDTLTVGVGTWLPETPPNGFTYLWKSGSCADGETDPVVGTGASYTVKPADLGSPICVTVTGTGANYVSATATSHATSNVAAAPLTTGAVTVTGTASVGQLLTADAHPSSWGPGSVTLTYQWYRAATAITGANASTYTPGGPDVGSTLSVRVTGTESGYTTATVQSSATGTVTQALFGGAETVSITGVADVGRTLTETVAGTLSPTPATVAIVWLRGGVPIPGATKPTYVLTASDMGQAVTVRVTSSESGWQDYVVTSAPTSIAGFFTTVPTPTITGTSKLGSTLTANPGTWVPTPTFDIAWRVNGTVVQDGAARTYTPTVDDVGLPISVTVTGSIPGYASASLTSASTAKVVAGTLAGAIPTITGTTTANQTLTANVGTWSPLPDSYSYQWYRSGKAITGATASSYLLVGADYAKTITVTVTGHLRGYADLAKGSKATAAVKAGVLLTDVPQIAPSSPVGAPIAVARGAGWGPGTVTAGYQWYSAKTATGPWTAVSTATGSTYTPVVSQLNLWFKVEVRGSETGFATSGFVSSNATQVTPGHFVEPTPTISGTAQVGSTLTAVHNGWSPTSGVTFHYQWYRGANADGSGADVITGATGGTYVVSSADVEKVLRVQVWASAAGYFSSDDVASAPTAKVMSPVSVVVSGSTKHGSTLTATPTSSDAITPTAYQWYYVSGTSVVAISGATHQTYAISSSYVGKQLKVRVTVTAVGYATSSTYSAATAKVT